MANRDNPNGLTPVKHLSGGEIREEEIITTASNAIIGVGDPLAQQSDGSYDRWASGRVDAVAASPVAASAGAGNTALAYLDPNIVYEAQTDNGAGTLTSQDGLNLNATLIIGNAVNLRSIAEIDESSGNTTATLPVKVIALSKVTGNAFGQFNRLHVTLNNTAQKGGTGTLGV